jgi:peroxiredoxin
MTAGRRAADIPNFVDPQSLYDPDDSPADPRVNFTEGGGSITLTAGGSIASTIQDPLVSSWLFRQGRADANGLVSELDVKRVYVGLGVHGQRFNSQLFASTDDAERDLATVGNQDLVEHGKGLLGGAVARLGGVEVPKHEDTEQTIEELKARIAKTVAFIESVPQVTIDASADRASAEASKPKCIDYFQRLNANYSDVVIQGFKLSDLAGKMLFEMTNLQAGSEAPEIEGKDKEGKPLKLSDFRGKHVIVIFWGGWCHACHGILPLMNETAAKFKDKPAAVLGVNTDIDVDAAKALATYQVTFPNILDNTSSGPNTTLYNLRNFPALYLIDPKGVILLKNATLDAMVARIEADLAK